MRRKLDVEERQVIAYVGSFGGWYLTDQMFDFFELAREQDPSTFILILTQREKEKVIENLKSRGFTEQDFLVESVLPSEIPHYLCAADMAISFIGASFSKQASSPTKIAEYLASGLPIICNSGVGDLDELIETEKVGTIVKEFSRPAYLKALQAIHDLQNQKDLTNHCKAVAHCRFDLLKTGRERYQRLYENIKT